ncbi:unnamed protein product [Alternaria alternata]
MLPWKISLPMWDWRIKLPNAVGSLEELLAPSNVEFYDQDWTFRGRRKDHTDTISKFTSIPTKVLLKPKAIYKESVGARMSWASKRVTKRTEDMAYCLLGIFEINMPLIYGEGKRAFLRLQEEIIKRSNDLTILGWDNVVMPRTKKWDNLVEVFATSPAAFARSADLQKTSSGLGPEFSITNRGLLLTGDFKLFYRSSRQEPEMSTYVLQIATTDDSATREIGLRKLAPRLSDDSDYITETRTYEDTIYIRTDFHHTDDFTHLAASRKNALHIPKQKYLEILRVTPQWLWDHSDAVFLQTRLDALGHPYYSSVVAVQFELRLGSRNPKKDMSWEDMKREIPWVLEKGDTTEVSDEEFRYNIKFFLKSDHLGPHKIRVISLKASITKGEPLGL